MRHAAGDFLRDELAIHRHDALADILGKIANAFEIGGKPDRRDDGTQIDSHGLALGDGENGFFFNLTLERIKPLIGCDDTLCQLRIGPDKRIDRACKHRLGNAAHFGNGAAQREQFVVEGADNMVRHGSLPGSAEAARDVILCALVFWCREDAIGFVEFDQFAEIHEGGML